MNRTYLMGYYGMQNSGDDALLAAVAYGAGRYLGEREFFINSPRQIKLEEVGTVKPLLVTKQRWPARNRLVQYQAALRSQRIIFGGGSVFCTRRDIDLNRDLLTLSGGKGHLALGVGVGPFESVAAERACAKLLKRLDFVGVRDVESLNIAKSIAPQANIAFTFDLAPTLLSAPGFSIRPIPRKGIAVCLCPKERLNGDRESEQGRLRAIADALKKFHQHTGEPITFLDFNGHPELGDRQVHQEVAAMLGPTVSACFVDYDPNPYRVLQRLAGFNAIVSMRLHGSVFGFMAETPVLSVNYHSKCKGWCGQIGLPDHMQFDVDELCSNQLFNALNGGMNEGFASNKMTVRSAAQAALKNWRNEYVTTTPKHFSGYTPV